MNTPSERIDKLAAELKARGIFLSGVVAMTSERVIGKNGGLPWHISDDLKVFKRLTTGHPMVMGRKTFDSLGRLLPNRQHIVMTRDRTWRAEGVTVIYEPEDLLDIPLMNDDVYVIGGAQIFDIFAPLMDSFWVSLIHGDYEGDTRLADPSVSFPRREKVESFADFDLYIYKK